MALLTYFTQSMIRLLSQTVPRVLATPCSSANGSDTVSEQLCGPASVILDVKDGMDNHRL
jgi:hypothetical protein